MLEDVTVFVIEVDQCSDDVMGVVEVIDELISISDRVGVGATSTSRIAHAVSISSFTSQLHLTALSHHLPETHCSCLLLG